MIAGTIAFILFACCVCLVLMALDDCDERERTWSEYQREYNDLGSLVDEDDKFRSRKELTNYYYL